MELEAEQYRYSPADYNWECSPWQSSPNNNTLSKFDIRVRTKWEALMASGAFRYSLEGMKQRVVSGPEQFLATLNLKRAAFRRPPEPIESIDMPYNQDRFNFTKVKTNEIVFQLCPQRSNDVSCKRFSKGINELVAEIGHDTATNGNGVTNGVTNGETNGVTNGHTEEISNDQDLTQGNHVMVINVSPVGFGHSLTACDFDQGKNQVMSLRAHTLAIQTALLSTHPGFILGFGSLCARASVNHQHFHTWYTEIPLTVQTAPMKEVCPGLYEMIKKPTRALVLQSHGSTVNKMARMAFTITDFYHKNKVAQNFVIVRGPVIGTESEGLTLRMIIWPRKSYFGTKTEGGDTTFNVAMAELAGFIPMFIAEEYEQITEQQIIDILQGDMLPDAEFDSLRERIVPLLKLC